MPNKKEILINPTGRFVVGGLMVMQVLLVEKLLSTHMVALLLGGGAFSGKDYTKVDRSAAYMARYLAKNIVASGITKMFDSTIICHWCC